MSHNNRLAKLVNVIAHMTDNRYFPEPWKATALSIAILSAIADRYGASIIAAARGDRDNIATRNENSVEVQGIMDKLANYVELEASDNMAAIRSSGFDLRRQRSRTTSPSPTPTPTPTPMPTSDAPAFVS